MYKQIFRQALSLSFLLIFLAPTSLFAADEKPPAMVEMWVIEVKDGAMMDFENAFKMHIKARKDAGDSRDWQVFTPHTGSRMNSYNIRYCCFTWADRDAYAKWSDDNKMGDHWNNNVAQYVSNVRHNYFWIDFENSNWPEGLAPKYIGVRNFKLKPGSGIEKSVKELSGVAKDMKWSENWAWSYPVTGDSSVNLVFPFDSFADMEVPDPEFSEAAAKHMGSEEKAGAMFKRFSDTYHGSYYTIYEHRPDLSMEMKN